jgi:hypothetical protein
MIYTLANVSQAPSYNALQRSGLSDIKIIAYYGTPKADRRLMLQQLQRSQKSTASQQIVVVGSGTPNFLARKLGQTIAIDTYKTPQAKTQLCTGVDIDSVRDMALTYMDKTYTYRGKTFNPHQEGWKFAFNDRKRALGLCSYRRRTIYLSTFFINQGSREMKMWVNTMVHEIAHAFAKEGFGDRGHGWLWKDMFISFGGDGKRCNGDTEFGNLLENPVSKYTLICGTCDTQEPSHKIKRRKSACSKCCDEHNGGRYSEKYVLRQIKNY